MLHGANYFVGVFKKEITKVLWLIMYKITKIIHNSNSNDNVIISITKSIMTYMHLPIVG